MSILVICAQHLKIICLINQLKRFMPTSTMIFMRLGQLKLKFIYIQVFASIIYNII